MAHPLVCIRDIDIYEGIPESEMMKIAETALEQNVAKGMILFSPENPADKVYALRGGEVELYHEQGGKKVVFETLFPGDLFGDFGIKTDYFAITTRPSYVCETPTSEFLEIVRNYPDMALRLMRVLAAKISDYEGKIASLSRPARDQVLDELRRLHYKNGKSLFAKVFHIPLRISHQKLAEKTGLNRVTVTKLLGELRAEGMVEVDEKTGEMRVKEGV
jgi:CRP/FNR family transcriptional regulator